MKNLLVILIASFMGAIFLRADEVADWFGPDIPYLHIQRGTNGKECVDEILKAVNTIMGRRVAIDIRITEAELSKRTVQGELDVKNVPSAIALQYVADLLHLRLKRDGVVWVLKDWTDEHHDMEVHAFGPVTNIELQELGLSVGEKGKVSTIHPPAWPSDPASKMSLVDGVLLVSAWERDIQCLKALLTVQRSGYSIPKINSGQGADQPATTPEGKSEGEDKPQPVESEMSSFKKASHDLSLRAPQAEAQEKIKRKEYQVYSAMGVSEHYPGIDYVIGKYVERRYSSIMLEGTSDAIESDEHRTYVEAAEQFASEFNREMISRMKELGLVPEPINVHKVQNGFSIDGAIFEKAEDVAGLIMKKTSGDNFWPVIISKAGMKSDEINQLFVSMTKVGYHNVLIKQ